MTEIPDDEVVVICGAGAAGMATALSAARAGLTVYLVEADHEPGGTVANCLIHTIGGLYDSSGAFLNDGLPVELVQSLARADPSAKPRRLGRVWVFQACPEVYLAVVRRWLQTEARIHLLCQSRVSRVELVAGRIVGVEIARPSGLVRLKTRAVVDTTGTADVVRLFDPALVQDDPRGAAGGLFLRVRGAAPAALTFPRSLVFVRAMRGAAEVGTLPARCGKAWLDAGVLPDEVYVKLFVPLPADWRAREQQGEISAQAHAEGLALLDFLRQFPEFADAWVERLGQLGIRDGGRIRGDYCLTADDVRQARKFPDPAARCCWPIEYWDPEQGVTMEYLPDHAYYEIPLRALKLPGVANLWSAGKCLSADRYAHASARVAGTCWAMGEAVGKAVASGGGDDAIQP